jgi:hypothetical protein
MSPRNLFAITRASLHVLDVAAPHRCVVCGANTASRNALERLGAPRTTLGVIDWVRTPVPATASHPNDTHQRRALST